MSLGTRVLVVLSLVASVMLATACSRSAPPRMVTLGEPPATAAADTASGAGGGGSARPSGSTSSPTSSSNGRAALSPAEYKPIDGLKTVHFDFDRTDVRAEDVPVLDRNAAWMLENTRYLILVEGHADERGTAEYNMALGDKRAKSTVNYLVSKGVPAGRFTVLSLGEERPRCGESTEACWAKNRRAVFLVKPE